MSGTAIAAAVADATTEIAAETAAAVVSPDATAQPTAEQAAATEAAAAEAATTATAIETAAKPDPVNRRIANLNRKAADSDRARDAAIARAEAAEALLAASRTGDGEREPTSVPRAAVGGTDVEARAAQLVAEREAAQTRQRVIDAGIKQFGEKAWNDRAAVLQEFGATTNPGFMEALLESENPTAIVAALTDDTGALDDLLRKSPAALATHLGRMDAGFSKPAAKPISGAPKPAARVEPGGGAVVPNIYDPKMSMADFQREMDKLLPVHLGGKRRVA